MDMTAVLALIQKGLTVIGALLAAGQSAEPAIAALVKFVTGAQQGKVTPEQLAQTDALLDQQIASFNLDMP